MKNIKTTKTTPPPKEQGLAAFIEWHTRTYAPWMLADLLPKQAKKTTT